MKSSLKTVPATVIIIVVVLLTLLSFIFGVLSPKETLDWLGLVFVLISEIVLGGFLLYMFSTPENSSMRIFQIGVISVLIVYWISSVILALFRGNFTGNDNYFALLNIFLIAFVAIITILLIFTASRTKISDSETSNSRLFMMDIEKKLFALMKDPTNSEYKSGLSLVYEKAKFSDHKGNSSYDSQLSNEVDNLKVISSSITEDTRMQVEKSISQILFLIEQRNAEHHIIKRGGH